jgi:hypothetical protein
MDRKRGGAHLRARCLPEKHHPLGRCEAERCVQRVAGKVFEPGIGGELAIAGLQATLAPSAVLPSCPVMRPRSSTMSPPSFACGVTLTTSHSIRIVSVAKTGRRKRTQNSRPTIEPLAEKCAAVSPSSSAVVCVPLAMSRP